MQQLTGDRSGTDLSKISQNKPKTTLLTRNKFETG